MQLLLRAVDDGAVDAVGINGLTLTVVERGVGADNGEQLGIGDSDAV